MIDKTTFIICLLKLLGLQIILIGVFFALFSGAPFYTVFICVGSLVFAIGSNILLVMTIRNKQKFKKEVLENGNYKYSANRKTSSINHCVDLSTAERLHQENAK